MEDLCRQALRGEDFGDQVFSDVFDDDEDLESCAKFARNAASSSENRVRLTAMFRERVFSLHKKCLREGEKTRRISWQMVYNCCVGQAEFTTDVFRNFEEQISEGATGEDVKTGDVICAIVYLYILHAPCEFKRHKKVLPSLLPALKAGSDFAGLCFRLVFKREGPFEIDEFPLDDRIALYDVADALIKDEGSLAALEKVCGRFKAAANGILTTLKTLPAADPAEVVRLCGILAEASSTDETRPHMQADASLLIDAIYLLRMLHEAGKLEQDGIYAPVKKLSQLEASHEDNPAYGFKRDLVRLIGNLCHGNVANQNQVRDCAGIELLLDCSPVDGKNPLITQWVILAIKNVCDGNEENQRVISNITKDGKMDKEMLNDLGIDIQR